MIFAVVLAATSCLSPEFMASHPQTVRVSVPAYLSEGSAEQREQRLRESFVTMDRNSDGYIAGAEVPLGTRGHVDRREEEQASPEFWLDRIDSNDDRKVDWQEFSGHFLPIMAVANCQRG
ncbi:EF-hand domain-containing protein [Brevundimonas sp.]